MATLCIPLGPLFSGEGSRTFLGLRITDGEASPCALIRVPEQVTCEPALIERLRRETALAAELTHPNILRVFGLTEVDEGLARVVEYADGESLRRVLEVASQLPPELAARVVVDAALGVQYAHLSGNADGTALVHGDLRPETLLLSYTGVTKVSGYGALSVGPRETGGRHAMGRRHYCAPEQILGGRHAVGPQTDVYLLGGVLYEALTGQAPFHGEKNLEAAVVGKQPHLDTELVPARLRPVIGKAMAKKGHLRFQTVQELREAVEEAVGRLPDRFDLGAFLEAAFADDPARCARRRVLEEGIEEWVARQGLKLAAEPALAGSAPVSEGAEPPLISPQEVMEVTDVASAGDKPPPYGMSEPVEATIQQRGMGEPVEATIQQRRMSEPVGAEAPRSDVGDETPPSEMAESVDPKVPPENPRAIPSAARRRAWPWAVAIPLFAAVVGLAFWMGKRSTALDLKAEPVAAALTAVPEPDGGTRPASAGPDASAALVKDGREGGATRAAPRHADVPPPPRAKPTLEVVSSPPLTVSIDGKRVGRSPLKVDVAPGPHRVTLADSSQGIRAVRSIHVKPGANRLDLTVGRGTVTVSGPNGCDVRIDGRDVGKTPLGGPVPVFEGSHLIQVTLGDAHWQETFTLVEGEQVTVDLKFEERG